MDLKDKINSFPKSPGIYLMKDKNGDVIYVGKSKKLQDRIKSYFVNSKSHSRKVQRLVKGIYDIDIIQTDTELDALLLECEMIKKIRPMYNKLMRNPENYVYLKIDRNNQYPYLQVVKEVDDESVYFGAYTLGKKLENIKEIINEAYKIRSCKKMTKCFKYDLNKCIGPCRDNISIKDYDKIIDKLISDINNEGYEIFKTLHEEMTNEIKKLNFEKANEIKQNIDSLNSLFSKQTTINKTIENNNILAWIKMVDVYKVYIISDATLINTEYVECDRFDNMDKNKYYYKFVNLEDKSIYSNKYNTIDKFDIDYVNIIYSYIKHSKDVEYIIIK